MTGRLLAAALAAALALVASGCGAALEVGADVDRDGRGSLELRLTLDPAAQEALGLPADGDTDAAAERFAPLLGDAGWSGGDGQIGATRDDDGTLVLVAGHAVDSPDQLDDLLSEPRPLGGIVSDPSTLAALPDLPAEAPLLNDLEFRLGGESGDNPGFDLFARGGLGDIGDETCRGDAVTGFGRSLRGALTITYRLRLPGGPGDTNAEETPTGQNVWRARYGDCPALRATSGGGSSSTLVNGVILAGLGGVIALVFALRGLRRRRSRREVSK